MSISLDMRKVLFFSSLIRVKVRILTACPFALHRGLCTYAHCIKILAKFSFARQLFGLNKAEMCVPRSSPRRPYLEDVAH